MLIKFIKNFKNKKFLISIIGKMVSVIIRSFLQKPKKKISQPINFVLSLTSFLLLELSLKHIIMKRITIISGFILLFGVSIFGQNLFSPDKQWNVRFTGFSWFVTYSTEIYKIDGDSTVNSKSYQKLWASFDSLSTWSYQGLVREEGKKVYFIPADRSEGLLYDFDLEIGDTARVVNLNFDNIPVQIIDKDTITLFGKQRVRWHISHESYYAEYWIEGIGSSNGPIHTKFYYNMNCPTWELLCLHQNDSLLYMLNSQIGCYQSNVGMEEIEAQNSIDFWPNPVKKGNAVRVDFGFEPNQVEMINSSGKVVYVAAELTQNSLQIETNSLATGLYLIRVINQENKTQILKLIVN